jgi:dynein heavy chain
MEKSYPSLKPLANYIADLKQRTAFFARWVEHGVPQSFWLSGFFFTQSFLTGVLQNYSRKVKVPVDEVVFDFKIIKEVTPHEHGAIIYGLYIEGARWDEFKEVLE